MQPIKTVHGESLQGDSPCWDPLLKVAPELVEHFMWMFEVELEDGRRVHAFKHVSTRRYLHLDHRANAFAYMGHSRYRQIDLDFLLEEALRPWWDGLGATPEETAACWTVIERARQRADAEDTPAA